MINDAAYIMVAILEESAAAAVSQMPIDFLPPERAWTRAGLAAGAGGLNLDRACVDEIEAALGLLRQNPLPIAYLTPGDFDMPACRAVMDRAKVMLEEGPGFAIVDRLPVSDLNIEEAKAIYWLLASMLARPVGQDWAEGRLLYDVRDSGKPFGYGVRPDITNRHQNFHTDNSYNLCPPRYVGLLCLETAAEGGLSGLVSFATAHDQLQQQDPDLLARLYRPYLFDRQKEHEPGDAAVISHPLFNFDGHEFAARLSRGRVLAGYNLADRRPDPAGLAALDALEAIMEDERNNLDFVFEPGQMQFVHNLHCGHRRTGFSDGPDNRRHLVRIWLRDWGRRFYNG